jgi:hypothetical protein
MLLIDVHQHVSVQAGDFCVPLNRRQVCAHIANRSRLSTTYLFTVIRSTMVAIAAHPFELRPTWAR